MTTTREEHLVELVDPAGLPIGQCSVREAHESPGRLHRAYSVLLLDPAGRLLLQRRAAVKTRFPLRWANSCCGHPAPGQPLTDAANHRLREELGIGPVPLTEIGIHVYQARDPSTGRIEFEYDHVLRGDLPAEPVLNPDPAEVADVRWADLAGLRADLHAHPDAYAPWLAGVLGCLAPIEIAGDQSDAAAERSGGR